MGDANDQITNIKKTPSMKSNQMFILKNFIGVHIMTVSDSSTTKTMKLCTFSPYKNFPKLL